jgi:hypothetical protein
MGSEPENDEGAGKCAGDTTTNYWTVRTSSVASGTRPREEKTRRVCRLERALSGCYCQWPRLHSLALVGVIIPQLHLERVLSGLLVASIVSCPECAQVFCICCTLDDALGLLDVSTHACSATVREMISFLCSRNRDVLTLVTIYFDFEICKYLRSPQHLTGSNRPLCYPVPKPCSFFFLFFLRCSSALYTGTAGVAEPGPFSGSDPGD